MDRERDAHEARARLLEQHAGLRACLAACRELADDVAAGEPVGAALAAELRRLRQRFLAHNADETSALVPLLARGAALGARRIDRMQEEHAAEHAALLAMLDGPAPGAAALADFADELEAHMQAEERTFLSPHALDLARR